MVSAVQDIIFLYCLLFLRKLTNEVINHEKNLQSDSSNYRQTKFIDILMYYNFVSQSASVLVFGAVFTLNYYIIKQGGEEEASCKLNTTLTIVYVLS